MKKSLAILALCASWVLATDFNESEFVDRCGDIESFAERGGCYAALDARLDELIKKRQDEMIEQTKSYINGDDGSKKAWQYSYDNFKNIDKVFKDYENAVCALSEGAYYGGNSAGEFATICSIAMKKMHLRVLSEIAPTN